MTVLLLLLIAYLVSGSRLFVPLKALAVHGLNLLQEEESKKLIEFYGVSKLMPIIAAFSIVVVLYVSMVSVRWIGSTLPVSLTYNPDALFISIDNSDRLARIWSKFSDVSTFSNLRVIIQERSYKAERELDKPFLGIANWESRAGAESVSFSTVKFLVLWALMCAVVAVALGAPFWASFVRTVGIWLALALAGVYFGFQYFYATEQLAHAQLNAVDALVSPATQPRADSATDDGLEKYKKLVSEEQERRDHVSWWNIRILDKYFYEWSYRTFIAGQQRSSNKDLKATFRE